MLSFYPIAEIRGRLKRCPVNPTHPFSYYLSCLLVVLVGMCVIHFTVLTYKSTPVWSIICYSIALFVLILCNLFAWTGFVWVKLIVSPLHAISC